MCINKSKDWRKLANAQFVDFQAYCGWIFEVTQAFVCVFAAPCLKNLL